MMKAICKFQVVAREPGDYGIKIPRGAEFISAKLQCAGAAV